MALILLELGTFDFDSRVSVEENLQKMQNHYSPMMKNEKSKKGLFEIMLIFRKCLDANPKNRPDCLELFWEKTQLFDKTRVMNHILAEEYGFTINDLNFIKKHTKDQELFLEEFEKDLGMKENDGNIKKINQSIDSINSLFLETCSYLKNNFRNIFIYSVLGFPICKDTVWDFF